MKKYKNNAFREFKVFNLICDFFRKQYIAAIYTEKITNCFTTPQYFPLLIVFRSKIVEQEIDAVWKQRLHFHKELIKNKYYIIQVGRLC